MRTISILFLVLCLFSKSKAQNYIEGIVSDMDNNPLTGAAVFLPELSKGTTTDKSGKFRLDNLPSGKLKIQFSFVGYNSHIQIIDIPAESKTLYVLLSPAVIETQEVVISAGYISSQHENAVKIEVLKKKDISLSGTPNFMESLTCVPGLEMISKGQGVSKPVIRGLSMNDILVLDNGVRIENYQFSEDHPIGIDDNDLERVEIIKGPASLLYGSDAIGGVLNFIKENPAPTGEINGDYRITLHSNTLGVSNSIGIKGSGKHIFSGIRFGHKTHADYLQGGGDFVPNTRFNEMTCNVNSGYTGKIGTFKVFYDYFKQDLGMSVPMVNQLITKQGRKNEIWYQDIEHQLVSSQTNLYLRKFKWTINGAFQNAHRMLHTTLDIPFIEMNLKTVTCESKLYLPSGNHSEYLIGFQSMYQTNRNLNNRASQFLPDANNNNFGFLGMAQHTVFNKVKLQAGLRFDVYNTETYALGMEGSDDYHPPINKSFSNLNGSFGATFSPDAKLVLRANFAKAFRVPNLSELTSNGIHGSRYEIGNENLSPQNAYESDLSLHYHGIFLSLDLAGFYNQILNYIFLAPTSDTSASGIQIYRFSQTNATLYGGEAVIHFHPKFLPWLHIQGSYSSVVGEQGHKNYLPFIPASKFRYEIRAAGTGKASFRNPTLKLSALTAMKQSRPSPDETETSGYTLVNLSFTLEILASQQSLVFDISLNNLFDAQYFDHLSTLRSLDYYNQGRNICLSIQIPFGLKRKT